jgi:hypothetical protein
MSRSFRRFEMLLPQHFNDGRRVPSAAFDETLQELKDRFGGVSTETQDIQGYSVHRGQPFTDDLVRIYVDVPDTEDNLEYFEALKVILKSRFDQEEIWIATHPVEVL